MDKSLQGLIQQKLPETVGPCYFRRRPDGYLLTNDAGAHARLSGHDFFAYMSGDLSEGPVWRDLCEKGFVRNRLNFPDLFGRFMRKNRYLDSGPGLHVISVSALSNQPTPYSPLRDGGGRIRSSMALLTARNMGRFIFDSPVSELTIEIRGGEPLMNWGAVEFILRHARDFSATAGRKLRLGMVTNLSLLDDEKLEFLMKIEAELCVPLDGPASLHDKHRSSGAVSSHAQINRWLRVIGERYPQSPRPHGWLSVTRDSLGRGAQIAEEYARLGFSTVQVRPLVPMGLAREKWKEMGVSQAEYREFYADFLGRLIELNRRGIPIRERTAAALLTKILRGEDPGLAELRSPSGGGLGQLAYQLDGDVYLSDEGRWLDQENKDPLFRLGDVSMPYADVVQHRTVKACAVASNLDAQPMCSQCAYKPFCGVSPVYNYVAQGTIWGRNPTNDRCAGYMGCFDFLFDSLQKEEMRKALESWVEPSPWEKGEPLPAFLTGGFQ